MKIALFDTYGKLKPTIMSGKARGRTYWVCMCDCGNSCIVRQDRLVNGNTRSCGCLRKLQKNAYKKDANIRHPSYNVWRSMKRRCYNSKDKFYKYYGGRGISVCDRWNNSFRNFVEDMGIKPKGMSIERLDNNGNYEPTNCEWATAKQQAKNRRAANSFIRH